ncbi:DUF308 domain-containing protein [Paraburkholderia lycopersici]|uniref:Uncharacterized membrane protein HdeD, DUF308 family n=1 Tax=Paraburkholderia lycopersici TaxID=416944 RepID=A0A1G6H7U4_9BURK|nr:DUF308 domain-containing protein [Paraburkholderia lycopersici]SDB90330.1 Uncharacterized membrane protein HdeD, DUF308 family [Paraburkholderia lycopersici]
MSSYVTVLMQLHSNMKKRAFFPIASSTLLVVAGILCIILSLTTRSLIGTLFIARMLLFCGFVHALNLFTARGWKLFIRRIPPVIVPVLIGILILVNDSARARGLTVMLMIFFVLDGFFKIIASLGEDVKINNISLVGAALSFLLAIFLAANFPSVPLPLLGLFLGLDLISMAVVPLAGRERKKGLT